MEKPVLILLAILVAGIIVFGALYLATGNKSESGAVGANIQPVAGHGDKKIPDVLHAYPSVSPGDRLVYHLETFWINGLLKETFLGSNETHYKVLIEMSVFKEFNTSNIVWTRKWLAPKIALFDLKTGEPEPGLDCSYAGREKISILNETIDAYKYACTADDVTIIVWLDKQGLMLQGQIVANETMTLKLIDTTIKIKK